MKTCWAKHFTILCLACNLLCAIISIAGAQEVIHAITPLTSQNGLDVKANHLIDAKVYKSLDAVLQGDRFEYWQDENGQFFLLLPRQKDDTPSAVLITLQDDKGNKIASATTQPLATNRLSFLVRMSQLKAGKYSLSATYAAQPGVSAQYSFGKSAKRYPPVTLPADGIPIVLEAQPYLSDATWPVKMGVPLPRGTVTDVSRLALFEDGKQIPAGVKSVATWGAGGSTQWAHLDFLGKYSGGKPAEYRLKLLSQPAPANDTELKVNQTDQQITVNTGTVRFVVSRKQFKGIEQAWFDADGKGHFDDAKPVIANSQGPFLVDARLIRFDASNDKNVQVSIEEQNAARVTILARGWYVNPEGRVPPLCQFVTRIRAYAGEPMVRVSHHTIITYDTRTNRLAQLGFHIGAPSAETLRWGGDDKTSETALPTLPQSTFIHQDRWNHFRVVNDGKPAGEGEKSDGWFSLLGNGSTLSVLLRDIWQKFPKEAEATRDGLTLHFWPKHGQRTFTKDEELDVKNIYKFWCFHQGRMLDLHLPDDYFQALSGPYANETFECRPEHALNGNGQGLAIGNEFAVVLGSPREAEKLPQLAKLYQYDPTAMATPQWNCATLAMGKVAAEDKKNFAPMEAAVHDGYLSWMKNFERGQEYGMWNYSDSHTYWHVADDRSDLHRVWQNSHYHEVGATWLMYYRTGSGRLLRWARPNTDNFMNVDTVNYAELENGGPKFKFHVLGAQYHCKGLTQWGAEDYGMQRRDSHAGVAGHWIDPDAYLWDWYLTGDERANDCYQLWADTYSQDPWYGGTRREANTTLAAMVNLYEHSHDASLLPAIRGMGISLRTHEPLENQNPGPMWHPLWINRYYELTRDPEYVPFILKYARTPGLADTWTTALGALAYELSNDKSYLTQHLEQVQNYPKRFFHKAGDAYDWYGDGPGPLGSRWGAFFNWGHFLYAVKAANLNTTAPLPSTRFSYLTHPGRFDIPSPPSLIVYALEPKDQAFTLNFEAQSLGGDLHSGKVVLYAPGNKQVLDFLIPPKGKYGSSYEQKQDVAVDGQSGLYRIEYFVHEASVTAPLTNLPYEVTVLPKNMALSTSGFYGLLRPVEMKPLELTIASDGRGSDRYACNVDVRDATGKVLAQASLFAPRNTPPLVVKLDPAQHKLPWKLDVYGPATVTWSGDAENLLMASSEESLVRVAAALPKPLPKSPRP